MIQTQAACVDLSRNLQSQGRQHFTLSLLISRRTPRKRNWHAPRTILQVGGIIRFKTELLMSHRAYTKSWNKLSFYQREDIILQDESTQYHYGPSHAEPQRHVLEHRSIGNFH